MNQAVARALRGFKGESSRTQQQIAELSGMSLSTVRRLLRGETDITATSLAALAGALETTPDAVIARVFNDLDYDEAYRDAVSRTSGRSVSEDHAIVDMDEKRAAALLDQAHVDGTERIAADINEESEYDEPEAP